MTNDTLLTKPQLILASSSPRRRELLDQIQVSYKVLPVNIDESQLPGETAEQFVKRLATEKAEAAYRQNPHCIALGSDTIMVIGSSILGKPENKAHGIEILSLLSGNTHQVMTAVAVHSSEYKACAMSVSEVEFAALTGQQIEAYWETGEPEDKAGAYGVQGIAAQFIKKISGSYSGIMGLPLFETAQLLEKSGIKILAR
jgi:nucleoside triphosphate pyrophosphatase